MIESEREKKWRPTDRRASSAKRESDVMKNKYPVTAKAAYDECFRKPQSMEKKIRALCLGKIRLGHALHAIDQARHEWNPQVSNNGLDKDVYNALRGIREQLEKLQFKYPLEVK